MRAWSLPLFLLLLPLLAGAATPQETQAAVQGSVHQVEVYAQARARLVRQRALQQQQAGQLSAQVADSKRHRDALRDASLRTLLQDALAAAAAVEATDRSLAKLDDMTRAAHHAGMRALDLGSASLSLADRVRLQGELRRVADWVPADPGQLPAVLDIALTPGMDAEALMERADLAGDYEDKLRREAARASARIQELVAQASLVGEAANLATDRRLFDEEDRALRATRVVARAPVATAVAAATPDKPAGGEARAAAPAEGTSPAHAADGPPPGAAGNATGGADFNAPADPHTGAGAGVAVAPAPAASVTRAVDPALPRSQTVVDQRSFTLLRETASPRGAAAPEDELRALQQRREALLRQAAKLKAVREELQNRAKDTKAQRR